MADKEERIEISIYDLNNKEWNGDIPIDIHKVYTRQGAIEVMAKAFCETGAPNTWNSVTEENKIFYLAVAEAALNALLEGVKKWK